ncbi:glycosyltransferase family 1 protein [Sutcliffiella horikoshii]|uniref:Glycosyltransferase family 1 protein n=1 Tax=Sutcliffiella horikoshii TaxID=79883 RepID=A0A5D4T3Y0_9BACI|nr:glycosyltransferase family 1 protein [Sutcliffiella horikoshii]TYS69999.1 glycosyltransferase family 1 protein [Sutcliffiella horikoshii]
MNEPIRVLHVVGNLNFGGVQMMLLNYYRNIDRNKVQFDFLVYGSKVGFFEKEIENLGGRILRVTSMKDNLILYNKEIKILFKKEKYSIIHIHHNYANIYAAIQAKRVKTKCIISHSHAAHVTRSIRKKIFRKIIRFFINKICNYKFACSAKAGEWLYGAKEMNKNKVKILKNGIQAKEFRYNSELRETVRGNLDLTNNFVLGHVGRFTPAKNHTFLINVFDYVYKKNNNARLVLIGDGEYKSKIKEKVQSMGLEKQVIFLGMQPNINELLQAFDVFLFPSLIEGLGITLIEAQASGIRCIASDSIPSEVKITGLLEFVSLNNSPDNWGEIVLKYAHGYKREDTSNIIQSAHYDIKEQAAKLQIFYMQENR